MMTRKKISIVGILLILAVIIGYRFFSQRGEDKNNIITVEHGAIIQEVRVTGKAKAIDEVDLAFESAGRIVGVYAGVGTQVSTGQILAELDRADLVAQKQQAEASVAAEIARLDELKRGTRPEEIAIQKVKVENAKVAVEDAIRNLGDKVADAYTRSDDAIYNVSDQLFDNPKTSPSLKVSTTDSALRTVLTNKRQLLEATLAAWKNDIAGSRDSDTIGTLTEKSTQGLIEVNTFLDLLSQAVNSAQPNSQFSQTNLDTYRANIAAARVAVNTGIANLSTAKEKYRSAQATLTLEANQLLLKNAGSTSESIAAQQAVLLNAAAKVQSIQAHIAKTILRAPMSGVISRQDFKVGEIAQVGVAGVSLISESRLQIEAQIPEVDIGHVMRGNDVVIAFDAFPRETFSGKVSYVDPASTLIDGVVNFKVTVVLEKGDPRLKSGLTANLIIRVLNKEGVLRVPGYALTERDGHIFATKQVDGKSIEGEVVVGARGQDGFVEIVSGLAQGDRVLNTQAKK